MKIFLEKAIFINRAPFQKIELSFKENEISVLSSVNGRGKTTIISHIADAFFELARTNYPQEFEGREQKYYRVSSPVYNLDLEKPSFVYLRFKLLEGVMDYVDIRNNCTEEEYDEAITIENKIPYTLLKSELLEYDNVKKFSKNVNKKLAEDLFSNNILTFFPSYRFELPGYLNDPYNLKLDFKKQSSFSGYLKNPIEVVTGLSQLANWIMDITLDIHMKYDEPNITTLFENLNNIMSKTLISKNYGQVSFGIGPRGFGVMRIQIVESKMRGTIYPSIFNLSSGEAAMLCLFGELLRQGDNVENNIKMEKITGIVLIDEVDKHLHIKLQKEILPKLFKLFPNVQFIVSSHSPFLSMGLAEELVERSSIIDLDSLGITKDPTTNELYLEVYNMMISENERFRDFYNEISSKVTESSKLQIISEGNNIDHIKKAIEILGNDILNEVNLISGSEDKSSDQKLKSAFEVMSKGAYTSKFLFVWDCDYKDSVQTLKETENFKTFYFEENVSNSKSRNSDGKAIGIENLYDNILFTDDVYQSKEVNTSYGGSKKEKIFQKNKFLEKVQKLNDKNSFKNYQPLIDKITEILKKT